MPAGDRPDRSAKSPAVRVQTFAARGETVEDLVKRSKIPRASNLIAERKKPKLKPFTPIPNLKLEDEASDDDVRSCLSHDQTMNEPAEASTEWAIVEREQKVLEQASHDAAAGVLEPAGRAAADAACEWLVGVLANTRNEKVAERIIWVFKACQEHLTLQVREQISTALQCAWEHFRELVRSYSEQCYDYSADLSKKLVADASQAEALAREQRLQELYSALKSENADLVAKCQVDVAKALRAIERIREESTSRSEFERQFLDKARDNFASMISQAAQHSNMAIAGVSAVQDSQRQLLAHVSERLNTLDSQVTALKLTVDTLDPQVVKANITELQINLGRLERLKPDVATSPEMQPKFARTSKELSDLEARLSARISELEASQQHEIAELSGRITAVDSKSLTEVKVKNIISRAFNEKLLPDVNKLLDEVRSMVNGNVSRPELERAVAKLKRSVDNLSEGVAAIVITQEPFKEATVEIAEDVAGKKVSALERRVAKLERLVRELDRPAARTARALRTRRAQADDDDDGHAYEDDDGEEEEVEEDEEEEDEEAEDDADERPRQFDLGATLRRLGRGRDDSSSVSVRSSKTKKKRDPAKEGLPLPDFGASHDDEAWDTVLHPGKNRAGGNIHKVIDIAGSLLRSSVDQIGTTAAAKNRATDAFNAWQVAIRKVNDGCHRKKGTELTSIYLDAAGVALHFRFRCSECDPAFPATGMLAEFLAAYNTWLAGKSAVPVSATYHALVAETVSKHKAERAKEAQKKQQSKKKSSEEKSDKPKPAAKTAEKKKSGKSGNASDQE